MKIKPILHVILLLLILSGCTGTGFIGPKRDKITFSAIYQYAEMADASYRGNYYINQKYQPDNEVTIYELTEFEVKYFVIKNHLLKKQYIVVRGTDNLENTITDLLYLKSKDPKTGIFFHSGFLEATDAIYKNLILDSPDRLSHNYETTLVGHSLGGAIVGILGTFLLESDLNLKWVITFGQPKFTNAAGTNKFKRLPFIRIVNQGDLVPMVPPTSLLSVLDGEYEHGGLEVFLDDTGQIVYSKVGAIKSEDQKASFWDTVFTKEIDFDKHLMGPYLRKINYLISKAIYFEYESGYEWKQ